MYKATILPRGSALGFVASINEDEFMATKESLLAHMDVCMGGRAAEEIYSGSTQITTGASSDFNQATRIATAMVCQYGMSPKVGRVYYQIEDINKLSPELENTIHQEVRRLLDESYHRAKGILQSHKAEWEMLANGLLEKETLSGEQIREMIGYDISQQIEPLDFVLSPALKVKAGGNGPMHSQKSTEREDGSGGDEGGSGSKGSGGGKRKKVKSITLSAPKRKAPVIGKPPIQDVQTAEMEDTLKQNGAELLNPNPSV